VAGARALGGAAALLVTAACSTVAGESVKAKRVRTAAVDKLFAKVDKPDTPGCALAVIQDGRIVYERGYGLADLDHDVSLFTTVEDLGRWDRNFDDPRVGGPSFVREMLQKGRLNDGRELDYASGLSVRQYRGLPIVEHAGGDAGYRSHFMRFPDQRFAVACLCNAGGLVGPSQVARRIADLYLKTELRDQPESSTGAAPTG
jgi:hypothetical protein